MTAPVQSASGSATSGTTVTVALTATGSGHSLVVLVGESQDTTNPTVEKITVNGGSNTDNFALCCRNVNNAECNSEIWYDPACASGITSVEVTFNAGTGTEQANAVWVEEWPYLLTLDTHPAGTGNSAGTTSFASGATGALAAANEIIVGTVCAEGGSSAPTITGPAGAWTSHAQISLQSIVGMIAGYESVTSNATQTYSGTTSVSVIYGACIASFTYATAAAPSSPSPVQPGATWRRQFRRRALSQLMPQGEPMTALPSPPAQPGRTWKRLYRAGEFRPMHPLQPGANQPQSYRPSGTPARPGLTWRRRFKHREQISSGNTPVPGVITGPAVIAITVPPVTISGAGIAVAAASVSITVPAVSGGIAVSATAVAVTVPAPSLRGVGPAVGAAHLAVTVPAVTPVISVVVAVSPATLTITVPPVKYSRPLLICIASQAGQDDYGNEFPQGVTAFGTAGQYAQLNSAAIAFQSSAGQAAPAEIAVAQGAGMNISSGQIDGADAGASVAIASQEAVGIPGGLIELSAGQVLISEQNLTMLLPLPAGYPLAGAPGSYDAVYTANQTAAINSIIAILQAAGIFQA